MRRRVGLFLVVGLVLPLAVAATASAQGATLQVTPNTARPGDEVRFTGTSFSSAAGVSPVSIRFSTRTGEKLREVTPDARGNISDTFEVPAVSAGPYLVLATQTTANGRQRAFTPARARLLVQSRAAGAAAPPPGGRGGLPGELWPLTILALIVLGAGATLTARRLRTSNRPQLGA